MNIVDDSYSGLLAPQSPLKIILTSTAKDLHALHECFDRKSTNVLEGIYASDLIS